MNRAENSDDSFYEEALKVWSVDGTLLLTFGF